MRDHDSEQWEERASPLEPGYAGREHFLGWCGGFRLSMPGSR